MRRREVFGLAFLATIRRPQAQGLSKVFRIGIVSPINLRSAPQFLAFEDRLREVGYVEGRNLTIEFLYLEGRLERYPRRCEHGSKRHHPEDRRRPRQFPGARICK